MAVTAVLILFVTFYLVALLTPSQAIINYTTEPTSTTFSMYLNGVTTEEDDCICGCTSSNSSGIEAEIAAIFEKLYLDATTTSQYRRKRTSAKDPRPSAQGIGYSGIICLVVAFLFFFVSDVMNVAMMFGK